MSKKSKRNNKGSNRVPTIVAPAKTGQHGRINQRLPMKDETVVTVNARTGKATTATPTENVVRNVVTAPHKVNVHAPAPEAAKVAKAEAAERGKVADAVSKDQLYKDFLSGKRVASTVADVQMLSSEQLKNLCRELGYPGFSGLTKPQLCEHVASQGTKYAPKKSVGPKTEELRAECKDRRAVVVARDASDPAYKGYSSQNKAGLGFMLANDGTKPQLKDGTYNVGSVSWLQQLCREKGVSKFSGLKKDELIAHALRAGGLEVKLAIVNAYQTNQMECRAETAKLILTYAHLKAA